MWKSEAKSIQRRCLPQRLVQEEERVRFQASEAAVDSSEVDNVCGTDLRVLNLLFDTRVTRLILIIAAYSGCWYPRYESCVCRMLYWYIDT